jgi:hypothetical protein
VMAEREWPADLLAACGGVDSQNLPDGDAELWLTLAAGIVTPQNELADDDSDLADEGSDLTDDDDENELGVDLSEDEEALVALCALDHNDWLAATTALARRGPGAPASEDDLGRYLTEYDPDDFDDQADAAAGMFLHAVALWRVLGAVDDDDRLTPLGWWGLPEALQRAWAPRQ